MATPIHWSSNASILYRATDPPPTHTISKLENATFIDLQSDKNENGAGGDILTDSADNNVNRQRTDEIVKKLTPDLQVKDGENWWTGLPSHVSDDDETTDNNIVFDSDDSTEGDTRSIEHDELYSNLADDRIVVDQPNSSRQDGTTEDAIFKQSKGDSSAAVDQMPAALNELLEQWYAKHGRVPPPPCATTTKSASLYQSSGGRLSEWYHKDGERLDVKLYSLADIKYKPNYSYRAIVVSGLTHGPHLVGYAGLPSTGGVYKIWYGVNGGDKNGFEETASILKRSKGAETMRSGIEKAKKALISNWESQSSTANGTAKITTTALPPSPAPRQKFTYNTSSGYQKSSPLNTSHKRKRDSRELADDRNTVAAFSSCSVNPTAHQTRASRQPAQVAPHEPDPHLPSERLDQHIQHNAVFLFYPAQYPTQQPRVRLFSACNSPQKLFAHALAGDVFPSTSSTKVLYVRIGGQTETRAVVEDDELDFQDLVTAIKGTGCWAGVEGKEGVVMGSCTVEVRAKA